MIKKLILSLSISLILIFGHFNNIYANKVLTEKYKEAQKLINAMKLIDKDLRRIRSLNIAKYLTDRIIGYQNMMREIKKKLKAILGLQLYNFVDFNLHYIYKLRKHYYKLINEIKGVHLLDSSKKIMQLLAYTTEQFLDLFSHISEMVGKKGKSLLQALEDKVWKKLLELHGKVKAKSELNKLHKLFLSLEKDIYKEVIEILKFMTRFHKHIVDFVRQYNRMSDDAKRVYVAANQEIVDLIAQLENYIEAKTIQLYDSKTHKAYIDKIEEVMKKYHPDWFKNISKPGS